MLTPIFSSKKMRKKNHDQRSPPKIDVAKKKVMVGVRHVLEHTQACELYGAAASTFGAAALDVAAVVNNAAICRLMSGGLVDKAAAGEAFRRAASLPSRRDNAQTISACPAPARPHPNPKPEPRTPCGDPVALARTSAPCAFANTNTHPYPDPLCIRACMRTALADTAHAAARRGQP